MKHMFMVFLMIVLYNVSSSIETGGYADFISATCSKFFSDIIMVVSSSMATRDRNSESARFEILSAEYR